jgi:hypothetical protein
MLPDNLRCRSMHVSGTTPLPLPTSSRGLRREWPLGFFGWLDTTGLTDGGHDIACALQVGDVSTVLGTRHVCVSNTRRAQFPPSF